MGKLTNTAAAAGAIVSIVTAPTPPNVPSTATNNGLGGTSVGTGSQPASSNGSSAGSKK